MAVGDKEEVDLKMDESLFKHEFLETSSFQVLFAKHRAEYLKSVEEFIEKACKRKKIEYKVDYEECTMEVATTKATRDPYIIIKGYDFIQLLSKGMQLEVAMKVLEDDVFGEIIPVKVICKSDKTFERRRHRLRNPKILKAIELLTKCHILISNKTVCVVGSYKGLNEAKEIIIGCFENVHPVFSIKSLMIKKDLLKKEMEGDWDRYLPTIKKTHSKK